MLCQCIILDDDTHVKVEEKWEYQQQPRFNSKWRPAEVEFASRDGSVDRSNIVLPLEWEWDDAWRIDYDAAQDLSQRELKGSHTNLAKHMSGSGGGGVVAQPPTLDKNGWTYAMNFPARGKSSASPTGTSSSTSNRNTGGSSRQSGGGGGTSSEVPADDGFHTRKGRLDSVRRRRWTRTRKYVGAKGGCSIEKRKHIPAPSAPDGVSYSGWLLKQSSGVIHNKFKPRFFVLNESQQDLRYYDQNPLTHRAATLLPRKVISLNHIVSVYSTSSPSTSSSRSAAAAAAKGEAGERSATMPASASAVSSSAAPAVSTPTKAAPSTLPATAGSGSSSRSSYVSPRKMARGDFHSSYGRNLTRTLSIGKLQTSPEPPKKKKKKKKSKRQGGKSSSSPADPAQAEDVDASPCSSAASTLERPNNSMKKRASAVQPVISKRELKELQEHGFSFEIQMADGRCFRLIGRSGLQRDTWIEKLQKFLKASNALKETDRVVLDCSRQHLMEYALSSFEIVHSGVLKVRDQISGWRVRLFALVPPGNMFLFRDIDAFRSFAALRFYNFDQLDSIKFRDSVDGLAAGCCIVSVRPRELRQMEYHRGEELVLTVRTAANKRFYFSPSTEKELVTLEKHLHDIRKWAPAEKPSNVEGWTSMFNKTITPAEIARLKEVTAAAAAAAEKGAAVDTEEDELSAYVRPGEPPIPKTAELPHRSRSKTKSMDGEDEVGEDDVVSRDGRSRLSTQNITFLDQLEDADEEDDEGGEDDVDAFDICSPPVSPVKMDTKKPQSSDVEEAATVSIRVEESQSADVNGLGSSKEHVSDSPTQTNRKGGIHSKLEQSLARGPSSLSRASRDEVSGKSAKSLASPHGGGGGEGGEGGGRARRSSANLLAPQPSESLKARVASRAAKSRTAQAEPFMARLKKGDKVDVRRSNGKWQSGWQVRSVTPTCIRVVHKEKRLQKELEPTSAAKWIRSSRPMQKLGRLLRLGKSKTEGKEQFMTLKQKMENAIVLDQRRAQEAKEYESELEAAAGRALAATVAAASAGGKVSLAAAVGGKGAASSYTRAQRHRFAVSERVRRKRMRLARERRQDYRYDPVAITTSIDDAFDETLKHLETMRVWVVRDFAVDSVPTDAYGTFNMCDAYVVLNPQFEDDADYVVAFDIHFWIGAHCQIAEQAVAAIKAVELSRVLEIQSYQYREVQGEESKQFLSYFGGKLDLVDFGGRETALLPVENAVDLFHTRLFHLKGTGSERAVAIHEVEVSSDSLNSGDVFILDTFGTVYVWFGAQSNRWERIRSLQFAQEIKASTEMRHSPKTTITYLLDCHMTEHMVRAAAGSSLPYPCRHSHEDEIEFWKILGGRPQYLKTADEGGDDRESENVMLYEVKIDPDTGDLAVKELEPDTELGGFSRTHLCTDACYVLDADVEMFLWKGQYSTKASQDSAMELARTLLQDRGEGGQDDADSGDDENPEQHLPLAVFAEHTETPLFRSKFCDWDVRNKLLLPKVVNSGVPLHNILNEKGDVEDAYDKMLAKRRKYGLDVKPYHARRTMPRPGEECYEGFAQALEGDSKENTGEALDDSGEIDFSRYDDETVYVYKLRPDGMQEIDPDGIFESNHAYVVIHGYHIMPTDEETNKQETVVISRSTDYALSERTLGRHSKADETSARSAMSRETSAASTTALSLSTAASGRQPFAMRARHGPPSRSVTPTLANEGGAAEADRSRTDSGSLLALPGAGSPKPLKRRSSHILAASDNLKDLENDDLDAARVNVAAQLSLERVWSSIYFWKGADCSRADFLRLEYIHLDALVNSVVELTNYEPVEISNVEQLFEPHRFMRLFDDSLVIEKGAPRADAYLGPLPHQSEHKKQGQCESSGSSDFSDHPVQLFRLVPSAKTHVSAVQIKCVSSLLSSTGAYVMRNDEKAFVWVGEACDMVDTDLCVGVLDRVAGDRELVPVHEGDETQEFWDCFQNGKAEYATTTDDDSLTSADTVNVYRCSIMSSSRFEVQELFVWDQWILDEQRVFVFDASSCVFVWIGGLSPAKERDLARDFVKLLLRKTNRSGTSVVSMQQGKEPLLFKSLFPAWGNSVHPFQDPYKPVNKRFEDECVFGKVVPYTIPPHLLLIKQQLLHTAEEQAAASKRSLKLHVDVSRKRLAAAGGADEFATPSGAASGRSNGSAKYSSPTVSPKPGLRSRLRQHSFDFSFFSKRSSMKAPFDPSMLDTESGSPKQSQKTKSQKTKPEFQKPSHKTKSTLSSSSRLFSRVKSRSRSSSQTEDEDVSSPRVSPVDQRTAPKPLERSESELSLSGVPIPMQNFHAGDSRNNLPSEARTHRSRSVFSNASSRVRNLLRRPSKTQKASSPPDSLAKDSAPHSARGPPASKPHSSRPMTLDRAGSGSTHVNRRSHHPLASQSVQLTPARRNVYKRRNETHTLRVSIESESVLREERKSIGE